MSLQQWIADNRDAKTTPRRISALLLKGAIEVPVFAVGILVVISAVWAGFELTPLQVPYQNESLVTLWVMGTGWWANKEWCFLTN